MTKLALGTVQFGLEYGVANVRGRVGQDEAARILGRARDAGIDLLDTAIAYGDSEAVLGRIGVGRWRIVTKLPPLPAGIADVGRWVEEQVAGSLARLGVPRLEAVLLHRAADLWEPNGPAILGTLEALRGRQLDKIGVSIYSPSDLDRIGERVRLDVVQAPFNVLDRRLIESGWLTRLAESGVEVHVRSVFLQGLLLMPAGERPARFARWASTWQAWDRWLAECHATPLQACLRYALAHAAITRVVVGVDSAEHLQQIVAAAAGPAAQPPDSLRIEDERLVNPAEWTRF